MEMIVGNGVGARAAQAPAGCLSPSLSLLILLFIFYYSELLVATTRVQKVK